MMRPSSILVALLMASLAGAQFHGNEWIDHSRQHWMFQVHANGLARIDVEALASAGFPVNSVDPRHIMLFNREKQVPVYIHGEADGVLDPGDYIEFRAQRNDAWLDHRLFTNPAHLANPYYSFFNDTIRYYLTWDETAPKERVKTYVNEEYDSQPVRNWFLTETDYQVLNRYYPGRTREYGATSGFYLEGEGYLSAAEMNVAQGNVAEQVIPVSTPRVYTGADAPMARVTTVMVGTNYPGNGNPDHHLQVSHGPNAPGTLMIDTVFAGHKVVRSTFQVPNSAMTTTLPLRFKVVADFNISLPNGQPYSDRQAFSNATVLYARDFNMGTQPFMRMILPDDPSGAPASISFNAFTGTPVIYAYGDTVRRIVPTLVAGFWRAMIPAHPQLDQTESYIMNQAATMITAIKRVNGTGYFTDFGGMDLDSALLIVTHATLKNAAQLYANDRQSSQRNPMETLVVDVDELYDQFGGGVPKHPLGIRRYCKYVLDTWSTTPRGLFLIGKSVQTHRLNNATPSYRPDLNGAYANCLVPSYGFPTSDPCFTINLNFNTAAYDIPVGRLSARTPDQVNIYRQKVLTFEAQQRAPWMKNILHFRGGFNANETNLFGNFMAPMKAVAQDTCFGGKVYDFRKGSSAGPVLELNQSAADSVRNLIEGGVTLMNFFAHAFADGFDLTIDNPMNYNWNGKYPMIIGNSCYIGNVHLNSAASTPELWVMMQDKGPIAFLASIDLGFQHHLASYTKGWYDSFSQVNYGRGIGIHMKHTAAGLLVGSDLMNLNTVHTFTLQGDPSLILNSFPLPDYSVRTEDIFFDPAEVTAAVDSFEVKAVIHNIGKAINAEIKVDLDRSAPMLGGVQTSVTTLTNVLHSDTARFMVATQAYAGGSGPNTFQVKVDLDPDEIPEMDDVINNVASTSIFISSGDLVPVYPYDYAIIPDPTPELKASTGDPFAPVRSYIFQIDTTDLFNSPRLESSVVQAPGGVVSWQPKNIFTLNNAQDSTVFFWRCRLDSIGKESVWYERSFQYITDRQGWGQAHYFQFKRNNFAGIVYDRPNREFDFFTGTRNLRVDVRGNGTGELGYGTKWSVDLQAVDYGNGCPGSGQDPAWMVAVLDPYTFDAWGTYWQHPDGTQYFPDHQFGNINNNGACRNRPEGFFVFPMNNATSMNGMVNMLTNGIPDGHHVLVYTWRYLHKDPVQQFSPGLVNTLQNIGVPFATLPDSVPFAMYFQKGIQGTYQDAVGAELNSLLSLSVWVDASTDRGHITTMASSYASEWHKLYWNTIPQQPTDSARIILQGVPVDPNAEPVDLFELDASLGSFDLQGVVSAQQYPRLMIKGWYFDIGNPVPDPMHTERWQLLGAPAPDCAIHPPAGFHNALNGHYQGQEASVAVAVTNVSEIAMDSLLMTAWVVGQNNVRRRVHYKLNAPLLPGATLIDTVRFSTMGMGGMNTMIIEANPIDTLTGVHHQLEQFHFNNIAYIRFAVEVDITNPLLDVTFDGIHILDGDIVSSRPEITITLNDENPVLLMDSPSDTTNFRVYLLRPNSTQLDRLYFRGPGGVENMQFIPASGPDNEAKILYRPVFASDGKYQLQVEATDQSNNHSGDNRYRVSFEVINRPTITEILNYPNPFTTNTRFVFTVTGHQVPTYMKIQILTVTGRVVREIGMNEIGHIRVGRNMTDFAWDGTDQFGDRLARGVYLYRVIARLNGEEIEYRETSASQYFNKGFGKMYLLK